MTELKDLVPINELLKALPGPSASPSTLWRWCRMGIKGVKLRTYKLGRRTLVDPEDFKLFMRQVAEVSFQNPQDGNTQNTNSRGRQKPFSVEERAAEARRILHEKFGV